MERHVLDCPSHYCGPNNTFLRMWSNPPIESDPLHNYFTSVISIIKATIICCVRFMQ